MNNEPLLMPVRVKGLALCIAVGLGTHSLLFSSLVSAAETKALETITVTGQKLNKSLKDTASAVTVITEDQFENGETKDLNDLATAAPNVVAEGFGAISIRGINGTGAASGGYAYITGSRARISTIVDGVTQSWSGYSFTPTNLWDTKQVEVLRGPQSTVQGTNSIGGALVVATNDPTYVWESSVRAGLENYENGNIKNNLAVMLNAPIVDQQLAMRIAVDGTKGEGWMNYAQASDELDTGPDVNDSENLNARVKLLWEPQAVPGLSAKLTYNHHHYEGEYLNWANDVDSGFSSQTMTLDADNRENIRLQDSDVDSVALDVDYLLAEGISNTFHLGYITTDVHFYSYPLDNTTVQSNNDSWVVENRVLFTVPTSKWSGVAGVYVAHDESDLDVQIPLYDMEAYVGSGTTLTSALFGEATYALTDQWNITAGGRVENEKVDRNLTAYSTNTLDQDTSNTILLPKLGVTYAMSRDTTLGATVQRGYNAGGGALNWDTYDYYVYDKETVIAYETSVKSQLTDALQVSANLFYNDYQGYQAFVDSAYIANIDSSHTYGLEIESDYWATQNLKLRGSVGLLDSKVDSDNTSSKGNELPNAAHTNLAAGFTQYIGQNLSFGADVRYVGEYYSDLENTEEYKAGDYMTADARVQYVFGSLTIDGYIKNLTDEDVIYYNNSGSRAAVGQTRTYGISATYRM